MWRGWGRLRSRSWPALAATIGVMVLLPAAHGESFSQQLKQAESLRTADHPVFVQRLDDLHRRAGDMAGKDQWTLRYLEAWQASYDGRFAQADAELRRIIDLSGDRTLATKAAAVLMDDLGVNRNYQPAFELANRLIAELPSTRDRLARFMVLANTAQLLSSAGQYDLAARYARDMLENLQPGENACKPLTILMPILRAAGRLDAGSPELQHAIDTCRRAGEPVFGDTLTLVKANSYLDEGHVEKAIALLRASAASIRASGYPSHMISQQAMLALGYEHIGDLTEARNAAMSALTLSAPGDINGSLRDAYGVLYRLEKKNGADAKALAYYEHYVQQDTGMLNDVGARALAYQMAQQHVLAQNLETERLSKQNNILMLQQALSAKAMETSRLYIALLLLLVIFAVVWLYRTKRSQLRFMKLAHHDGLTGIYNHQRFMTEAARQLQWLQRRRAPACLLLLDLDHFKQINDSHGHACGDLVLKHTTNAVRRQLRPQDVFGRLGGEEFGILLVDCSHEQGLATAKRLCHAVDDALLVVNGQSIRVSASLGVAASDRAGYDLQRLCIDADAALYRAKHAGRNQVMSDRDDEPRPDPIGVAMPAVVNAPLPPHALPG